MRSGVEVVLPEHANLTEWRGEQQSEYGRSIVV